MSQSDGLICAHHIDASGNARTLTSKTLSEPTQPDCWSWLHFDRSAPETRIWLERSSGLDENVVEALLAQESRPRCNALVTGTLLNLRGVNLNPNSDPEDMISIQVWIEKNRIITLRRRRLMAVDAIRKRFETNQGPQTIGDFVVDLADGLVDRMSGVLLEFDDEIDALEEITNGRDLKVTRQQLLEVRQILIPLRRYLSPQRDALAQLMSLRVPWLDDWQRGRTRELLDRVTRFVEELDAARERTAIIHDAVANQLAERSNNIMLLLSIVAAVFLPLSFLTGLLGINVGGIPGAETSSAFWIVSGALTLIGVAELWLFRRMGWI